MSRRTTGLGLIGISAFLFSTKFIAAAIFGSGVVSWNADLYHSMLTYVDQGLSTASLIALISGVVYLIWGELTEIFRK